MKSIFNKLYVKVRFNKGLDTKLIDESSMRIFVKQLNLPKVTRRRLYGSSDDDG